jgi:hypothetical protein
MGHPPKNEEKYCSGKRQPNIPKAENAKLSDEEIRLGTDLIRR